MATSRIRGETGWRQLALPGVLEQIEGGALEQIEGGVLEQIEGGAPPPPPTAAARRQGGGPRDATWAVGPGADWETRCWRAAYRLARQWATAELTTLEAQVHATRPPGYGVDGWRERWLVTPFGEVRVRRRLYRGPDGRPHCLLDEHLGWAPRQVVSPTLLPLLVEWAATVPFRTATRWLRDATAGVVQLSGSTTWRTLQRLAGRVRATERAVHTAWEATGALPQPPGRREVPLLFAEADGVWVKTQRAPTHPTGLELKCASVYEGWAWVAGPTPGHPRPQYRLQHKQVYCHAFPHAAPEPPATGAAAPAPAAPRAAPTPPLPFWDGVSLALARTYDLGQVRLVVVGGDGATWIDRADEVFARVVRHRDGFHLARDATRGWGPATGAAVYAAVRAGDQTTTEELLTLPAPRAQLTLPAPARLAAPAGTPVPPTPPRRSGRSFSRAQVQHARRAFLAQVALADAGADWRAQLSPAERATLPPHVRALGTMEGTNAHLLAKRMKKKGMAWSVSGAWHLAKARELVTNQTLASWCQLPGGPAPFAPEPPPTITRPGGFAPPGPRPWPQVTCPPAHGPLTEPTLPARLHAIDRGGRHPYRLN